MDHSKYYIELHYSITQNDLSIFRTDGFFTRSDATKRISVEKGSTIKDHIMLEPVHS